MTDAYDLVVANGTIVTAEQGRFEADIAIQDGRITAIGALGTLSGTRRIDASGYHVLPGVIDPHTHHGIARDIVADAETESRSGLVGGVTTTGNMLITENRAKPWKEIVPDIADAVADRYYHDYYFVLAPLHRTHIEEIPYAINELGVTNFKWFNNLKQSEDLTEDIADEMVRTLTDTEVPTTLGFHSENTEITAAREAALQEAGCDDYEALLDRFPGYAEAQSLVAGVGLARQHNYSDSFYAVHVSSKESVEELRAMDAADLDFLAETCPHYLTLTAEESDDLMKINPPIRRGADREALWDAIADGLITCIGSDHCSKPNKVGDTIWDSENAFPGSGTMLPLILSAGVHEDRISLAQAVALTSTNTAKAWNLYPKKGTIRVGSDADLAIVDLNKTRTVSHDFLRSACEYSIYEGQEVTGWPAYTIVRGEVCYAEGEIVGDHSHGRFIHLPVDTES
jgi:dihydropyrimidinase